MATITATNGTEYHLWGLPDLSAPEPEDMHEVTVLENELSEGYRSRQLFGQAAGLYSWRLTFPTLAGGSVPVPEVTAFNELVDVTREKYVRTLYANNQTTGESFVYQYPPTTGQYYLVDFINDSLTYKRVKSKSNIHIYSASVEMKQRRIQNVSVFDVSKISDKDAALTAWYKPSNFSTPTWTASAGSNGTATGDVVKVTTGQNGQDILRFNNSANTGYITATCSTVYEIFLPIKMREATFSNSAGIITGTAGTPILTGAASETKFASQAFTSANYEYRLNGDVYNQSNQQAPMNEWGIVHVRYTTGWSPTTIQFGRNQGTAGTYAEMDIGEPILTGLLSKQMAREITEYLAIKYGVEL